MLNIRSCTVAVLCLLSIPAVAQRKNRVIVAEFVDHSGSGKQLGIGVKAADAVSALVTHSGKYTVVDRDALKAIAAEKNLVLDAEFDPKSGVKLGLQKVAEYIITGKIDDFTAVQNTSSKGGVFKNTNQVTGTVNLSITLTITSLETTENLGSATATASKTGIISSSSSTATTSLFSKATSIKIPQTSNKNATDGGQTMQTLADDDVKDVAGQLIDQIMKDNMLKPPVMPKFLAVVDGEVLINHGADVGIEAGKQYELVRPIDTGTVDPDTGQPAIFRKKVCNLTVTSVDDKTSQGKCVGGTPMKGDELRAVSK